MTKTLLAILGLALASEAGAARTPPRASADDVAISALLDAYRTAVTAKDERAFEPLLLSKDIPFAYVPDAPNETKAAGWRDYEGFRRAVFQGPPFTQRFRDVHVRVHGALANVDLVYVNVDRDGFHPGWKTMQLIKVSGRWRIVSEFFTDLPSR